MCVFLSVRGRAKAGDGYSKVHKLLYLYLYSTFNVVELIKYVLMSLSNIYYKIVINFPWESVK